MSACAMSEMDSDWGCIGDGGGVFCRSFSYFGIFFAIKLRGIWFGGIIKLSFVLMGIPLHLINTASWHRISLDFSLLQVYFTPAT